MTTRNPADTTSASAEASTLNRTTKAGHVLTDEGEIDDAHLGTAFMFPSGRVVAELDGEFADQLPAKTRHYHWKGEDRALEALNDPVDDGTVWIEWTR